MLVQDHLPPDPIGPDFGREQLASLNDGARGDLIHNIVYYEDLNTNGPDARLVSIEELAPRSIPMYESTPMMYEIVYDEYPLPDGPDGVVGGDLFVELSDFIQL